MVPKGRRHAPSDVQIFGEAALRAIPVAAGARGDCASPGPGPFHAGDRAPARSIRLDDLPGVAAQRSHPQRWAGVSRDDRPMACRAIGPAPEADEACPQRDLAHLCRGEIGWRRRCSERCSHSRSCRRPGRAAGMASDRIGDGPGPGARNRLPGACRSTFRTTRPCASATKPSIRPSSSKAKERCAANSRPACEQDGCCGCRGRGSAGAARVLSRPRS